MCVKALQRGGLSGPGSCSRPGKSFSPNLTNDPSPCYRCSNLAGGLLALGGYRRIGVRQLGSRGSLCSFKSPFTTSVVRCPCRTFGSIFLFVGSGLPGFVGFALLRGYNRRNLWCDAACGRACGRVRVVRAARPQCVTA